MITESPCLFTGLSGAVFRGPLPGAFTRCALSLDRCGLTLPHQRFDRDMIKQKGRKVKGKIERHSPIMPAGQE